MTAINWITNEINNYDGGHRFQRGGPQMTAINWITNEINNYDGGHRFQLVWDKKRSLLLK